MATVCVEEDRAVQAARILLTLKNRRLLRRPEWVEKEPTTAVAEFGWSLEWSPKRQRTGGRRPGNGRSLLKKLGLPASAGSSGDERERSPRWTERPRAAGPVRDELTAARRPDSPAYDGAPSGSGPSTSGDRRARPHLAVEKASMAPAAAEPPKEPMKAPSPETPLDFGASAAGSGASSSGDDAARPTSKRRAPGAGGSGACSGDEGCSSPDKRARLAEHGDGDKAISEPKMPEAPGDRDNGVKFSFDLNLLPDDEDCPGFS